jgi:ribonuclease P protein component
VTEKGHDQGLGRSKRIRKRSEFLAVQQQGCRLVGRMLVLYTMVHSETKPWVCPRLGITVSKKVGTAVVRNRVKRWIRESFRKMPCANSRGLDYVVIAKPFAAKAGYLATKEELNRLLGSFKES